MEDIFEILITCTKGKSSLFILLDEKIPVNFMVNNRYFLLLKGDLSLISARINNNKTGNYNRFEIQNDAAVSFKNLLLAWYDKPKIFNFCNSNIKISINNKNRKVNIGIEDLNVFLKKYSDCIYSVEDDLISIESFIDYEKDIKLEKGLSKYCDCLLCHESSFVEISKTGTSDNSRIIKHCNNCDSYFVLYCIDHPYGGYDEWYSPVEKRDIPYIKKGEYESVDQFSDIMIIKKDGSYFLASRSHYYANKYQHSYIFKN